MGILVAERNDALESRCSFTQVDDSRTGTVKTKEMEQKRVKRELRVNEQFYLSNGRQRVTRSLIIDDNIVSREDTLPQHGEIGKIVAMADALSDLTSDKCTNSRYKVGDYTGDPGYLLYIIFKARLRLQFIKFKIRLFKFFGKSVRKKSKPTHV